MLGKKFLALEVWGKIFVPKTKSPMPPAPPPQKWNSGPQWWFVPSYGLRDSIGRKYEQDLESHFNTTNGKRHAEFDIL